MKKNPYFCRNYTTRLNDMDTDNRLQRWQKLSGSGLKMLAVVTMLIDHLALYLWRVDPAMWEPLLTIGGRALTPYLLLRGIGRLAFPIFAFLIVEGYQHTRDRWRYGRNLLLFAILSEVPWNLVHTGTWHYSYQNVFFTLFLGYLGICAMEHCRDNWRHQTFSMLALLAASVVLRADYGAVGFGFILLVYILRHNRLIQTVIGSCTLPSSWVAGLAFIPINMYNGCRGFIQGPVFKYAFYAFYPLHLLVIYLLQLSQV